MESVVRKFALVALSATALTALSQSASAAVLWDITGGAVPVFNYSTAVGDNNVVNVPGQPAANNTGSTLVDTSNTATWLGSTGGGSPINAFASFSGLVGTVTVDWIYAGSESGDQVRFTTSGLFGSINFVENDINNNNMNLTHRLDGPVNLGNVTYSSTTPSFTAFDIQQASGVTNGGLNGVPNNHVIPSMIFSYATCLSGTCTLSGSPTDTLVFGFNDTGSIDDNHDDIMIIGRIISSTERVPTPIPGALPLFSSVLGGGFLFRRYRKRRQASAA